MLKRMALKTFIVNLISCALFFYFSNTHSSARYGEILCKETGYHCVTVKQDERWGTLFPDKAQRDLVKRVNRMNVFLKPGMVLAIPNKLNTVHLIDLAPFALHITPRGEKIIDINLKNMAWAAYNDQGTLIKWGPASSGVGFCPEDATDCSTPTGIFRVIRKQGETCVSSAYPKRMNGVEGGAAMPYCIHFYKGYALHGSDELTGRVSSHGCVNLFTDDAQWLNQQFVSTPNAGLKGTLIVIR